MANPFKTGEIRDAYEFKTNSIPTIFPGGALCRYLYANEDIDVRVVDMYNNSKRIYMLQGEERNLVAKKVISNEAIGGADTQFDISNISGDTYRYLWNDMGVNPLITALSIPIGVEISISNTEFNGANEGTFVVTGSGDKYFEVSNGNGVVESNVTIGDMGTVIPYTVIPRDYVSIVF